MNEPKISEIAGKYVANNNSKCVQNNISRKEGEKKRTRKKGNG